MKQVSYGVRELQARIGDVLRAAQRGERVLITSRGRVVAVVARAEDAILGESAEERKMRRLAAEGKVRLGRPGHIRPRRLPQIGGLSAQLRADRR